MKKILMALVATALLVTACHKKPPAEDAYLRLEQASLQFPPTPGAEMDLVVESNMTWKLTLSPAAADWLQLDKTEGTGNMTVHVKVIKDNITAPRTAEILAAAANQPQQVLARVMAEQKPYAVQVIGDKFLGGKLDENPTAVLATADGGCVIAGTTYSSNNGDVGLNHGNNDFWVVKLNSNRDTVWTRTLGGDQSEDANAIAATKDNGYIVAGYTNSNSKGQVGKNHGGKDFWVVKLNQSGDTVWTKTLGGVGQEEARSVVTMADGSYIIAGSTYGIYSDDVKPGYGQTDFWVVKLSSNGQIIWTKTLGGPNTEYVNSVVASSDGGCVLAGSTSSTSGSNSLVGVNHGDYDFWVVKLNNLGDTVWTKTLGGKGVEEANSICTTNDGGYVIAGSTDSNADGDVGDNHANGMNTSDYWVIKLNASGGVVWQNTLGGEENEEVNGVVATPDGGCVLGGYTESNNTGDVEGFQGLRDYWIVKVNSSGQKLWQKVLGSLESEVAKTIAVTPAGEFWIAGYATRPNRDNDFWIVKLKDH